MRKKQFAAKGLAGVLMAVVIADFTPIQSAAMLERTQNVEEDTAEEDTAEEDTAEEDTAEEDTAEEDTAEEDTAEEDTTEEDTVEEDTVEEDTAEEDTAEEDTAEEDTAEEDTVEEDTVEEDTAEEEATEEESLKESTEEGLPEEPEGGLTGGETAEKEIQEPEDEEIYEMDVNLYIPIAGEKIFMPVEYNEDSDAPALIVADGYSVFDAADYMLSITSVSVNGKTYAATEKSGDVVIRSDGKLNVEAEAFAGGDVFEVTVSSEGYEDLQFIYIVGDSQEKLLRQLPKNSGEQSVPLVNDIVERSWIKENIKESSSPVISRSLEQTEDNGRATWTYRISRKIRIPAGK